MAHLKRSAKKMPKHALYAYVEGYDLDSVANPITDRLSGLINDRDWISGEAWVVNQKRGDPANDGGWELGMNLELPDPHSEPDGWFADIEEIAIACNELAETHRRSFIIGIADQKTNVADDLFQIDGGAIDIERLRAIIGVDPPTLTQAEQDEDDQTATAVSSKW
ncbi:MAG: hypothetical protein ACI9R3_004180 [Verrucomicrobiales bacterium]